MVYKKLQQHLRQKVDQLKDNPIQILEGVFKDNKEVVGRPFVSAVQIKIVR
jgi:hypothetical protein